MINYNFENSEYNYDLNPFDHSERNNRGSAV